MGSNNPIQTRLNDQLHRFVLDFDTWAKLASKDPESFERRRGEILEAFFAQIPQQRQQRLRGLQFRIDMERRKAKSPMGACIKISAMMWDSVGGENGLVDSIRKLTQGVDSHVSKPVQNAAVLPFRKRV